MARDLVASREAILAAAASVFAERGYRGASLQVIATAAGVSRGMPGYAFGSKSALYQAVLARAFERPRALVTELDALLRGGDAASTLRSVVGAYLEFLADNPGYVRLLQRAALDGGSRAGQAQAHLEALTDGLASTGSLLRSAGVPDADPRQLLVSVLALCFFPFAHRDTLLGPLGLDPDDPDFVAQRKDHVVDLLLHGLLAPGGDEVAEGRGPGG